VPALRAWLPLGKRLDRKAGSRFGDYRYSKHVYSKQWTLIDEMDLMIALISAPQVCRKYAI